MPSRIFSRSSRCTLEIRQRQKILKVADDMHVPVVDNVRLKPSRSWDLTQHRASFAALVPRARIHTVSSSSSGRHAGHEPGQHPTLCRFERVWLVAKPG